MTSFTHSDFPTSHAGIGRILAAARAAQALAGRIRQARSLFALLLAGSLSALVVVADQWVSTWADGQMVVAWVALWLMLFGALLLFAEASHGGLESVAARVHAWRQAHAQRRQEEAVWRFALADPRFMRELQAARYRAETEAEQAGTPAPAWPFSHMPSVAASRPWHLP